MSLNNQDVELIIKAVIPLIQDAKQDLQQEIRHIGIQVEVYRDEARTALTMLADCLETQRVGQVNSIRLDFVESDSKNIKALLALHDQQLRPISVTQ